MTKHKRHFAVCVDNADYEASLILRKIYEIIPDEAAAKDDFVRIVDESGEDYLYHKSHFTAAEFPTEVERALLSLKDDLKLMFRLQGGGRSVMESSRPLPTERRGQSVAVPNRGSRFWKPSRVSGKRKLVGGKKKISSRKLSMTLPPGLSVNGVQLMQAMKLYEVGKVSLGQAAKLAGFSKRAFMEVLGRYRIPVFDYSREELRQEIGL